MAQRFRLDPKGVGDPRAEHELDAEVKAKRRRLVDTLRRGPTELQAISDLIELRRLELKAELVASSEQLALALADRRAAG